MRALFRLGRGWLSARTPVNANVQPVVVETVPQFTKHRSLVSLYDLHPDIGTQVYIAPNATVVGDVFVGHNSVIWHDAVLRGDLNGISLHSYVVVGDRTVIHTAAALPTGIPARVDIGPWTQIQSNCTLYSCTIGTKVLVGHRSVIMEGAKLEDGCAIGPNSVVPPGRIIPANQLWAGNPVQYICDRDESDVYRVKADTILESTNADYHNYEFLSYSSAYLSKTPVPEDTQPKEYTSYDVKADQVNSYTKL